MPNQAGFCPPAPFSGTQCVHCSWRGALHRSALLQHRPGPHPVTPSSQSTCSRCTALSTPIWLTHPRDELKTRRRTFRLVDRKGRLNLWEGEGRFPVNDIMCGFKVKQVLCWIRASALGAGTNQNNISCHPRIKADKCLLCCSASRQPGSLWKRCNSPWMQHLTLNAPFLCVSQPLICHRAPNFKQIWMCSECLMGRLHGGGKIPSGSSGMERQMAESWDQSLKTTWLCWNKCFTTEAATP